MSEQTQIDELKAQIAKLELSKQSNRLKSFLKLDDDDDSLEKVNNLQVKTTYDCAYNDEDEYFHNLNSDIEISYNYTFSNNKEFKVSLEATYHTYMDYNCRYNDDITWNSKLIIKNEEDKTVINLTNINQEIEDLEDEMEGLAEVAKFINKVLSYIDEDNRGWNDMIKYVGDY
jgi:hypothetical protein